MKKTMPIALMIGALIFASFSILSPGLQIGDALPKSDRKLKDVSGKEVSMKDAMGERGLLVMFSCNTCPYVVKNQSATKAVCTYALSKQVGVILLNANEGQRDTDDSYNDMKAYAGAQGYQWYYAVDQDNVLADAFGASRTPEVFLFNKAGKLVYHGAINDNPADPGNAKRMHLREAMNEMLGGSDVSVKETRSVGCGIKRKA